MQAATDERIVARARDEDRIIISADSDFSTILAAQDAERPSFTSFVSRISWSRRTIAIG
jgi:predicted nuclease of predicted toxin-antitoxin system